MKEPFALLSFYCVHTLWFDVSCLLVLEEGCDLWLWHSLLVFTMVSFVEWCVLLMTFQLFQFQQPRPRSRPNSQHLPSDQYSLLQISGSPNSNGNSMSPPNGSPSPENGNANTEYGYDKLNYEDEIMYIDEIDETTPMNNGETLRIEDNILLTKTTSV